MFAFKKDLNLFKAIKKKKHCMLQWTILKKSHHLKILENIWLDIFSNILSLFISPVPQKYPRTAFWSLFNILCNNFKHIADSKNCWIIFWKSKTLCRIASRNVFRNIFFIVSKYKLFKNFPWPLGERRSYMYEVLQMI